MNRINPIIKEDIREIISDGKGIFDELEGKTLLITGSSGMIGSYFLHTIFELNKIFKKKCKVSAYIHGQIADKNSIHYLKNNENICFVQQDLSDNIDIQGKVDYIIHAASHASPDKYRRYPTETMKLNTLCLFHIMDYAVKNKSKVLFISSGEIYGNPEADQIPTSEDYVGRSNHLSERSCYAESKRFGETICINYFRKFAVNVKIARPIHVFGPNFSPDDSRVWADFIKSGLNGKDIEILGDGESSRGFCYIADGILQMWYIFLKGIPGGIYNVGNPLETTIKEFAQSICDIFDNKIGFKILNRIQSNASPIRSCPDISKVSREFGLSNKYALKEGLRKTIAWAERGLK